MMKQMSNNVVQRPVPAPGRPQSRPPRWRFRWGIVGAIGAVVLAAWVSNHLKISVTWTDVTGFLNVQDCERYSELVVLGLAIVGVLLVTKHGRSQ